MTRAGAAGRAVPAWPEDAPRAAFTGTAITSTVVLTGLPALSAYAGTARYYPQCPGGGGSLRWPAPRRAALQQVPRIPPGEEAA